MTPGAPYYLPWVLRLIPASSLTQALQEWDEAPWRRPCDPVRVLHDGEMGPPLSYCLALEEGHEESVAVEWQIRDEANAVVQEGQEGPGLSAVEVRVLDGRRHVRLEYLPRVVSRSGTTV